MFKRTCLVIILLISSFAFQQALPADAQVKVRQYILKNPENKNANCSNCHKSLPAKIPSTSHHALKFNHMKNVTECSICHDTRQTNHLHLLDGTQISFSNSYLLCGQCHGKVVYDWEHGFHGKLSGSWNGEKSISNCSLCHDAHNPKFKKMESLAPPPVPKYGIVKH